jgi:hypothetical protein
MHKFEQYAYSGTEWVQFNGGQANIADGTTTILNANVLSVKQFDDGGVNNVSHWQGLIPSDLNTIYAPFTHTHTQYSLTTHTHTLVDLDDTNIQNPQDGQVLKYDSVSQKWIPGTDEVGGSGGGGSPYTFEYFDGTDPSND